MADDQANSLATKLQAGVWGDNPWMTRDHDMMKLYTHLGALQTFNGSPQLDLTVRVFSPLFATSEPISRVTFLEPSSMTHN
ncbi:hypothetical protein TRIATDRAFT_303077 [Trichoderma atroviride IMI 206040]|uniref:Uncharacterized protein n=1 Tax=Hypocrea atroviridis (strain ATCC 20476 / IMI 206040) TaxID=452589 RepID=G9PBP6_HYPAI|nr:uncharacterized protein TRIATDRAFT_303077 [Trichoderma atroviride IMI 206040]EHK39790.1 hypothetical protein TRIATDRAFT_303077 [Trichoderma atroviride IMI 206040]